MIRLLDGKKVAIDGEADTATTRYLANEIACAYEESVGNPFRIRLSFEFDVYPKEPAMVRAQ